MKSGPGLAHGLRAKLTPLMVSLPLFVCLCVCCMCDDRITCVLYGSR